MDCQMGNYVVRDKNDIIKDCKYCRKTDRKGFGSDYAYGYECRIKSEKRHCKRCRYCYFGPRFGKFSLRNRKSLPKPISISSEIHKYQFRNS